MRWVSIDAAGIVSGVAIWEGERLKATYTIRPCGGKGRWYRGGCIHPDEYTAWSDPLQCSDLVIAELARGQFRTADRALFERIGYLRAICGSQGVRFERMNLSEWRRIIRELFDIAWPKGSDRCKAHAVALAAEHLGLELGDDKYAADQAEAALMGYAALKSGIVHG